MTPAPVFETSGHVARFADWMVKDTQTGDVLRADHLVKGVLEARLAGDREARGMKEEEKKEDDKKRKKKVKATAVKLDDAVVREYETILAKVCIPTVLCQRRRTTLTITPWNASSMIIPAQNWATYVGNTISPILTLATRSANPFSST